MSDQPSQESQVDLVKREIERYRLTAEEKLELGIWLTGKGMQAAWTEAVEGLPD